MHAREWVTVGTALSLIGHLVGAFLFSHHFHFLHITFTITNATFAIEIALSHLMAECHFYDQGPCATFKKVKLFTTAEDCAGPALTGINWWDIFFYLCSLLKITGPAPVFLSRHIIPVLNPDGYEYSASTDRFWRYIGDLIILSIPPMTIWSRFFDEITFFPGRTDDLLQRAQLVPGWT